MKLRLSRSGLALAGGAAAYILLFKVVYVFRIAPVWGYMGLQYAAAPLEMELLSFGLSLLPALWLPIRLERPSEVVWWLSYLLVLVPGESVPMYSRSLPLEQAAELMFLLFVCFSGLVVLGRLPLLRIPQLRLTALATALLVGAAIAAMYAVVVAAFGVRMHLPSLANVYSTRAEYRETVASSGALVAYAVYWLAKVINPGLVSYGLVRRRWLLLATGIAGQLFLFGITGSKSALFSSAFLILMLMALWRGGSLFGLFAVAGGVAVVAGSAALDILVHRGLFVGLIVRRVVAVPGLLTGYYYAFFSSHPHALLGHSVLGGLSEYPYRYNPPALIGLSYFRDSATHSNANVWADGYANFGIGGMLGFSVLFALLLWLYDSASRNRDLRLSALVLSGIGLSFTNSALLTTVLTHGLALATVLIYLLPAAARSGLSNDAPPHRESGPAPATSGTGG